MSNLRKAELEKLKTVIRQSDNNLFSELII